MCNLKMAKFVDRTKVYVKTESREIVIEGSCLFVSKFNREFTLSNVLNWVLK